MWGIDLEKLDSRLLTAAEFVNPDTIAADVGTDHGYLACYLIDNDICKYVYASDINAKPLESAQKNILEAGLEDKIETCLTDGLDGLSEKGIEEIVICGMGGENIIGILEKAKWIRTEKVHLVLQPMSRGETLRKWLLSNGWYIDSEKAVEADKHLYTVMSVYYSGEKSTADEMYYLIGELEKEPDETAVKYIRWQSDIQREIADGLLKSKNYMETALIHQGLSDMLSEEADYIEENL